jgi:hypothetical protein
MSEADQGHQEMAKWVDQFGPGPGEVRCEGGLDDETGCPSIG